MVLYMDRELRHCIGNAEPIVLVSCECFGVTYHLSISVHSYCDIVDVYGHACMCMLHIYN